LGDRRLLPIADRRIDCWIAECRIPLPELVAFNHQSVQAIINPFKQSSIGIRQQSSFDNLKSSISLLISGLAGRP